MRLPPRQLAEVSFGDAERAGYVDLAGEGQDRVVCRVMTPVVPAKHGLVELAYLLFSAGDGEAERVAPVDERPREVVRVDLVAFVVEILEDLLEDDAPLDVNI